MKEKLIWIPPNDIQMNLEGLKDDVVKMLARESVKINPYHFSNDMVTFNGQR